MTKLKSYNYKSVTAMVNDLSGKKFKKDWKEVMKNKSKPKEVKAWGYKCKLTGELQCFAFPSKERAEITRNIHIDEVIRVSIKEIK